VKKEVFLLFFVLNLNIVKKTFQCPSLGLNMPLYWAFYAE
jgi:hypothetical protein